MSFELASAFVQFGVQGVGTVDSAVARIKSVLSGVNKSAGNIDLSKGVRAGVNKMLSDFKGHAGNMGTLIGETVGSIKAGKGVTSSITAALSLAGPEIAGLLASPITGGIVSGVTAALATIPGAIERETKLTKLSIQAGNSRRAEDLHSGLKKTFAGSGISPEEFETHVAAMAQKGDKPEKIISQMRTLGNISTATGASMGAMAEALERAEASGRITGRTLQAMRPVAEELARTYGVSTQQIFEMGEQGAVRVKDLQAAMDRLGGSTGIWGNALQRMQHTTGGAWEKLWSEIKGLFTDVGTVFLDAFNMRGVLQNLGSVVALVRSWVNLMLEIAPIGKAIGAAFELVMGPMRKIVDFVTELVNKIRDAVVELKRLVNAAKYYSTVGLFGSLDDKREGPGEPAKGGSTRGQFEFTNLSSFAEKMQGEAGSTYTLPQQQLEAAKEANGFLETTAQAVTNWAGCIAGTAIRVLTPIGNTW